MSRPASAEEIWGDRSRLTTTVRTQLAKSRPWGLLRGKWSFFHQKNPGEKKSDKKKRHAVDRWIKEMDRRIDR